MSNIIPKPQSIELYKFRNGQLAELKNYSDEAVIYGNRIEMYRVIQGIEGAAKILSSYVIQANILLADNQRIPVNQIIPICKQLLDGPVWNLTFEEFSNIIMTGITGGYGTLYRFDIVTIGGWIRKYIEQERKAIFANKEFIREQKRSQELDSMGANHTKLFKSVLGKGGFIKNNKESAKRFKAYDSKIKKLQNK